MTVGIQVFNDTGTIQIDDNYSCFGVSDAGTCTLVTDSAPHPQPVSIGTVTVDGICPVIALRAGVPTCVVGVTNSGSSWTFHLRAFGSGPIFVPYYIFDTAGEARETTDVIGMAIYRADGELAFHTAMPMMRIIDFNNMAEPPAGWTGTTVDESLYQETHGYVSGRNYGVIQSTFFFRQEMYNSPEHEDIAGPPDPGWKWMTSKSYQSASWVSGGDVNIGLFVFETFIGQQPVSSVESATDDGDLCFMMVDITEF